MIIRAYCPVCGEPIFENRVYYIAKWRVYMFSPDVLNSFVKVCDECNEFVQATVEKTTNTIGHFIPEIA